MHTIRYPYDGPPMPVMQQFSKKKDQQAEEIRYSNELERFYAMYPEEREINIADQHRIALRRTESHDIRCLTYYAPWVADRYYIEYPVQDNSGKLCNMNTFHRAREGFFAKTRDIIDIEILNYDIFIYDFLRNNGLDRFKATYSLIDWMLCDRPVMYADGTFDESDKMPVRDVWQATFDDPNMSQQEINDLFKVYENDYLEKVVHRVDAGVYNDYEKQLMNLLFEAYRNEIQYLEIADNPSIEVSIHNRLSGIIQRMHFIERNRRIAAQNKYIASLNEQNSVYIEKTDYEGDAAKAEGCSVTEETPDAEEGSVTDVNPEVESSSVTDENPEVGNNWVSEDNSEPEEAPIQKISFCPKCGRKTDGNPGARFCAGCGALLDLN